jgi:hypothetical protein
MASYIARILILCKTYPSPSGKHVETSCVAGLAEDGSLIRLFPVPFRLIDGDKRFHKWQWITARVEKAPADHRPESHKIFVDTIQSQEAALSSKNGWAARRAAIEGTVIHDDFESVERDRIENKRTLALLRPSKILSLEIKPADTPDWTDDERKKLEQNELQMGLFDTSDAKPLAKLRKLPFSFYYHYECIVDGNPKPFRNKIADWEAGALYWNCRISHGENWEAPFRQKLMDEFSTKDLIFLMGTVHRFPDQWLIVSLIYPPKLDRTNISQQSFLI